jgi:hypothetical protein
MEGISVVGLDLAKNVLQVHDIDAAGGVVVLTCSRKIGPFGAGKF